MLRCERLSVAYGGVQVLWDVSFEVGEGELVALIGANGAGKTTTLNTLSGLLSPLSGRITLDGTDLHTLPPYEIVRRGVSQVPEGRLLFPLMTVVENLEMGAYHPQARQRRGESLARVYELFPVLGERRDQVAGTLSGGEQQMLAIGRALMSAPKVLLLDEPSLGLAPYLVREIFGVLTRLKGEKGTILLVEQNVRHALEIADRGYVLESGRVTLSGEAKHLLANEHVRRAFLGI